MKIMFMVPYLSGRGGMETVLIDVANYLNSNKRGFDADFAFPQGVKDTSFLKKGNNVSAKKIRDIKPLRQILGFFQTLKLIKQTDADMVICMSTRLISIVNLARKLFSKNFKIVSWMHFSLSQGSAIKIDDLIKADYHLSISSGIEKQLIDNGVERNRIYTIFNPIKRHKKSISLKNKNEFIYIARLQYKDQKNFKSIIEASKLIDVPFKVNVYGDGPDKDYIISKVNELGISDKFTFHGWESDPWSQISDATALLLSSKSEGFPTVLGESISRGLPVISSNCLTGPDDIVNKYNGFLYEVDDNKKLSELMLNFIDGKTSFSNSEVKGSIEPLYEENYYNGLKKALSDINNR